MGARKYRHNEINREKIVQPDPSGTNEVWVRLTREDAILLEAMTARPEVIADVDAALKPIVGGAEKIRRIRRIATAAKVYALGNTSNVLPDHGIAGYVIERQFPCPVS